MESEVDIAASMANIDKNWAHGAVTESESATLVAKVFSNYAQYRTSSFYIKTWKPSNKSSDITFQLGTKTVCEMFEHNSTIYENPKTEKNKNYWTIPIEPAYDQNKVKNRILLRGRAAYVKSEVNDDLERVNYSYVDLYEKYPWLGIQYSVYNPDEDHAKWNGNHHQNYHKSRVHNLINLKELDKLNLHIEVDGNNFNIIRGDKVPVVLIRKDMVESLKINKNDNYGDIMDLFYSGWYYVKGFVLHWSNSSAASVISGFTHEFNLTRREWPTPIPIQPIKTNV
jgi:hypothetical protein